MQNGRSENNDGAWKYWHDCADQADRHQHQRRKPPEKLHFATVAGIDDPGDRGEP